MADKIEAVDRLSFQKSEKLTGEVAIARLFETGASFVKFPLRVVYAKVPSSAERTQCHVLVSVSKKKFKRAVKRNRMKRLIREAYRLNKYRLRGLPDSSCLDVAFVYVATEMVDFKHVERAMQSAMVKLSDVLK